MQVAHVAEQHPGGAHRGHPGGDVPALVAADEVEGEGGAVRGGRADLPIGHQPQLHQGLEPVADAQHQSVPIFQQVMHRVRQLGVAQEGHDEFGRAVRLIAAGETAGENDHLTAADGSGQGVGGPLQILRAQVPDYQDLRLNACLETGGGGVVLAVGAGEHRNHRPGPGDLSVEYRRGAPIVGDALHRGRLGTWVGGIDLVQHTVPQGQQLVQAGSVLPDGNHRLLGRHTDAHRSTVVYLLRQLRHNGAGHMPVPGGLHPGVGAEADAVAQGHLHHALGYTARLHRPGGGHLTRPGQLVQAAPGLFHALVVVRPLYREQVDRVVRRLELGGEHLTRQGGGHGEGDQGGGNVQVQEGSGHGVLSADGGHPQPQLGVQSAQQRLEGLAPSLRLLPQLFKVFLESEVGRIRIAAGRRQLGHGQRHGRPCSPVGVGRHPVRVEAPAHHRAGLRHLTRLHREGSRHHLGRGALGGAAIGHKHGGRSNRAVKPLSQPPAGAALQAARHGPQASKGLGDALLSGGDKNAGVLYRAVGAQEGPGQVSNSLPLPGHHHPGTFSDYRHPVGLQVLPLGGGDKRRLILWGHHHGHALLGLGNSQLRAVQTIVLLAHGIQVDGQSVGQLADGHAHTAGAEVVAAFDQLGHRRVAEQPLKLALLGGVALLYLAGHGSQGRLVVALGGAGSPTDAIPAGAPAQQDDHVAGGGALPDHVGRRCGAHHGTHLQVLGDIPLVIDLIHQAGGQTDLVAIGGVARRRGLGQLALGQLALQSFAHGRPGVAAAGQPHGLVHIGPAGQGVPDAAADAGGRAAEGLDLGGVIVGLVLEQEQPVLLLPVHHGPDPDGAGVDLLALVQILQQPPLLQGLGTDGGDIHEGLGPHAGLLLSVYLCTGIQIAAIGLGHLLVHDLHRIDMGGKGGMSAVIRPIGVHHPHLGDGGIPALLIPEIGLEELQVGQVHGQAILLQHPLQSVLIQGSEPGEHRHPVGGVVGPGQGVRLVHERLSALHGVDEIGPDFVQVSLAQAPGHGIHPGVGHGGLGHPRQQHDALGAGVRPLVVLAGQGLHRQQGGPLPQLRQLLIVEVVTLGLGKYRWLGRLVDRLIHPFHIVAVEQPQPGQSGNPQLVPQLPQGLFRLHVKPGPLLHIASKYLAHSLFSPLSLPGSPPGYLFPVPPCGLRAALYSASSHCSMFHQGSAWVGWTLAAIPQRISRDPRLKHSGAMGASWAKACHSWAAA